MAYCVDGLSFFRRFENFTSRYSYLFMNLLDAFESSFMRVLCKYCWSGVTETAGEGRCSLRGW